MYMGHVGIALAGTAARPRIPLAVLLLAALGCDVLFMSLAFAGRATDLLTHSIPAAAILGFGIAAVYVVAARDLAGAAVVAAVGLSHWGGDWITSRIPSWAGGPTVGLHLYLHDGWDFALECALVIVGWSLYRRTLPEAKRNRWPAWVMLFGLIGFQLVFQAMDIT